MKISAEGKISAAHVVVIGSGIAGLLAAAAVAPHVDAVTVVERDRIPAKPAIRTGIPQARHPHLLMPGGAVLLERLVPGVTAQLVHAGAHRIELNRDLISYTPGGWLTRYPTGRVGISCSRTLLDHTIFAALGNVRKIEWLEGVEITRLLGTGHAVTGVEARDRESGVSKEIPAQLVIDATGRGSKAGQWLVQVGLPAPEQDLVDSGHAYATRLFRAPAGAEHGFPVVMILPDPTSGEPSCNAVLMPIEDGRWLVTLGTTRGRESPTTEAEFIDFALREVRHPLIGELIACAQPLSGINQSRSTGNRRYRFDKMRQWPNGLVITGDAAAAFNPVYGHGLSFAARCAGALRHELSASGPDPSLARRAQRSISRAAAMPWLIATSQDTRYRNTDRPNLGRAAQVRNYFGDRVMRTAGAQPDVARAWVDVMSLSRPFTAMLSPKVALGTALGPRKPPLSEPPLTPAERKLLPADTL